MWLKTFYQKSIGNNIGINIIKVSIAFKFIFFFWGGEGGEGITTVQKTHLVLNKKNPILYSYSMITSAIIENIRMI